MLVDEAGCLTGLFTDSDLARLLEARRDHDLDQPIAQVMTCQPATLPQGSPLNQAIELLGQKKISELPIVNPLGHPVGLIDITDIVELTVPA